MPYDSLVATTTQRIRHLLGLVGTQHVPTSSPTCPRFVGASCMTLSRLRLIEPRQERAKDVERASKLMKLLQRPMPTPRDAENLMSIDVQHPWDCCRGRRSPRSRGRRYVTPRGARAQVEGEGAPPRRVDAPPRHHLRPLWSARH